MLWPLAVVPVREHQHQPAEPAPLRLRGAQELVDDDLGHVREVPELRLPDGQSFRFGGAVAVLEPEHRGLGEHGVDDPEPGLAVEQVLERGPGAELLLVV